MSKTNHHGDATILVVDDNAGVRQMLLRFLGECYNVVVAENGNEGLRIFRSTKAIDLVISDVDMPIMDGHTMTAIIRRERPSIPILMISGQRYEGGLPFLPKPLPSALLHRRIEEMIGTAPQAYGKGAP